MIFNNQVLFLANIIVASIFTLICFREGKLMLTAWVAVQGVLANIFVLKQITLFGLNVTASDVFTISGMLSVTVLQAFFSEETARKAVKASCLSLLFFAIITQLHLRYLPSPVDYAQPAYKILFGPNFRIILASITAYWISQRANIEGLKLVSRLLPRFPLQIKAGFSIASAQIMDTFLFAFMGLWGLVSNLGEIILFSCLIKLLSLALLSNVVVLIKNYMPLKNAS